MPRKPTTTQTYKRAAKQLPTFRAGYQAGKKAAKRGRKKTPKEARLVALRHTGKDIDPYGPPDPQDLVYAYGRPNLSRALYEYTMERLKMAARKIEAQHPEARPPHHGRKASLIAFIVKYS